MPRTHADRRQIKRMLAPALQLVSPTTARDRTGRELLFFGGCNYAGLGQHRDVLNAVSTHLPAFGLSAGASRTTTGNTSLHLSLENALAEFLQVEAAALLPDGYTANIAAVQALAAEGFCEALLDARAHPSLRDAARAAGLELRRFPHRTSPEHTPGATPLILTDGVFTADGATAPIEALLAGLPPQGRLVIDDCHGLAAIGPGGRGSAARFADDPRLIITTTLAKGLGAAGGVVAGSQAFVDRVRETSAFVCTTPIAPALAAGTLEALRILRAEPERLDRLADNARLARSAVRDAGIEVADHPTPIIGFAPFDAQRRQRMHQHLLDAGLLVPLVEYPGGADPLYFRLIVTSEHTAADLELLKRGLLEAVRATEAVAQPAP